MYHSQTSVKLYTKTLQSYNQSNYLTGGKSVKDHFSRSSKI